MTAFLAVLVLGCALSAEAVSLRHRGRRAAGVGRGDAQAVLVALAVRVLAVDRAAWGLAMTAELQALDKRAPRWRFALGCLRASLLVPARPGTPGRFLVAVVSAAASVCAGLVAYGLVRYPGLRTGIGTWLDVAAFLVALAGYVGGTVLIVRGIGRRARAGSIALLGGPLLAGCWTLAFVTASAYRNVYIGVFFIVAVPLLCLCVGPTAARQGRSVTAGRQAAVLSAVIAGMLVFIAWVTDTLVTAGRPYDAGLIHDFAMSGGPDLATYAVSDNLGAGMMLLLIVPMTTAILGAAGSALWGRFLDGARAE